MLASPTPRLEYIKAFSNLLVALQREGYKLLVVVGGGKIARDYIAYVRELEAGEQLCDEVGIAATRMNAMLLCAALGENASGVARNFEGACESEKIFVMGGLKPGQTTDAVAAELAARCKADLLLDVTDVDGIYDSDPKKTPGAKKFDSLSYEELLKLVSDEHTAGVSTIIDPTAAKIIRDKKIKTIVLNGRKLENIKKAIKSEEPIGTTIG